MIFQTTVLTNPDITADVIRHFTVTTAVSATVSYKLTNNMRLLETTYLPVQTVVVGGARGL